MKYKLIIFASPKDCVGAFVDLDMLRRTRVWGLPGACKELVKCSL